jgi:hypothetical protein
MEVAEIALDIAELLDKNVFVGPLYYRFTWDKVICLVPAERFLSDLKKYQAKGARTVYVASKYLDKIKEAGLSYCEIRYGSEYLIPGDKRRYFFQLLSEAGQRLQKVGVKIPQLKRMNAEIKALIYLLSTNSILAKPMMDLIEVSPQLVRHSIEVALLAQLLHESTSVNEEGFAFDTLPLLLGLVHDVGKVQLPDDLREKNRSQLTKTESLIFNSYSQNLSLMVERDPAASKRLKKMVDIYDKLERGETFVPYEEYPQVWLTIIANRLAENVLPESHFASMGKFKSALLRVEAEGLGLPIEIVKSFKLHVEGRWKLAA